MRRFLVAVPAVALVLVMIGGLWPVGSQHEGSDSGLTAVIEPLGLETRIAEAGDVITWTGVLSAPAISHNHRHVFFRGEVICGEGDLLSVRIDLVQGDAEGRGLAVDHCTGEPQRFEVRVVAVGRHSFETGDADYSGWAIARQRGGTTSDRVEWQGTVTLLPER